MAGQARHPAPAQVRRVRAQFENWRRTKVGRERIPERLWAAAIKLCERHRVHRVARWLRLNDTDLRDRVRSGVRRGLRGKKPSAPAFVEWVSTAPTTVAPVGAEYVLELQDGRGADLRIRVCGAGVNEVAALATLVRGGGERAS